MISKQVASAQLNAVKQHSVLFTLELYFDSEKYQVSVTGPLWPSCFKKNCHGSSAYIYQCIFI